MKRSPTIICNSISMFLLILTVYVTKALAQSEYAMKGEIEYELPDNYNYWSPPDLNWDMTPAKIRRFDPSFGFQLIRFQNQLSKSGFSVRITSGFREVGANISNKVVQGSKFGAHNAHFAADVNFTYELSNTVKLGAPFSDSSYAKAESFFNALADADLNMPMLWDAIHIEPSPQSPNFGRFASSYSLIGKFAVPYLNSKGIKISKVGKIDQKRLSMKEVARLSILASKEILPNTPLYSDIEALYHTPGPTPQQVLARTAPAIWMRVIPSGGRENNLRRTQLKSLESIILDIARVRPLSGRKRAFRKPHSYWAEQWDNTAPIFGGKRQ